MEIKINKEVRNYTESIFFFFFSSQCICSAFACMIGVVIYMWLEPVVGMEITSWLCILGAAPFAALGFITYQQMNAWELLKTVYYSFWLSHTDLIYQPFNLYFEACDDLFKRYEREALGKNDKKLFKIKKAE